MSNSKSLQKTPSWVWWTLFPGFGGIAFVYAGLKANCKSWIGLGIGFTLFTFMFSSTPALERLAAPVWFTQMASAFYLKKRYLIRTTPRHQLLAQDLQTAQLIAEVKGKIDLNSCSQDDLVYGLNLPIVYANQIISCRRRGFVFTHPEELVEVAGIPRNYLERISILIDWTGAKALSTHQEDFRWKPINTLSAEEMFDCGVDLSMAQRIERERQQQGYYKSLSDVKVRTGLPLPVYQHLL